MRRGSAGRIVHAVQPKNVGLHLREPPILDVVFARPLSLRPHLRRPHRKMVTDTVVDDR